METIEELREQRSVIMTKINKIEAAETRKKNLALVGKCFKYPKNSYSMPKKASDYWPVYYKITGLSKYGVKAFVFQTDSRGRIEVKQESDWLDHGVVPIPESEFQRALLKVKRKILAAKP